MVLCTISLKLCTKLKQVTKSDSSSKQTLITMAFGDWMSKITHSTLCQWSYIVCIVQCVCVYAHGPWLWILISWPGGYMPGGPTLNALLHHRESRGGHSGILITVRCHLHACQGLCPTRLHLIWGCEVPLGYHKPRHTVTTNGLELGGGLNRMLIWTINHNTQTKHCDTLCRF